VPKPTRDKYQQMHNRIICELELLDEEDKKLQRTTNMSVADFMLRCNITSLVDYHLALRCSLKKEAILYKRKLCDRNVNPFNKYILHFWKANIDVQYCLHPYSVGQYIVSYMCKGNLYMSKILKNMASSLERSHSTTLSSALHTLGSAMIRGQEVSSQEAVYHLLGLPLRYSSRAVEFINTGKPCERILMLKPKSALQQMPSESTDIFEANALISRYEKRPPLLENFCLADYCSWFDHFPIHHDDKEYEEQNEQDGDVLRIEVVTLYYVTLLYIIK
jgi:hypothetical protein